MDLKTFFKKIRTDQKPSKAFHDALTASLLLSIKNNPPAPKITLVVSRTSVPFIRKGIAVAFAALFILFATGALTVFAAEKTLPGNTLYPVKLAVDQLSVTLFNSPSNRTAVANRRLQEVQQVLAAPSSQNAQTQADIQSALQQYRANLQGTISAINKENVASSTVQNVLQAATENQSVLKQIIAETATGTVAEYLKDSLHSSEIVAAAANTALGNHDETNNDPLPRTNRPAATGTIMQSDRRSVTTEPFHKSEPIKTIPSVPHANVTTSIVLSAPLFEEKNNDEASTSFHENYVQAPTPMANSTSGETENRTNTPPQIYPTSTMTSFKSWSEENENLSSSTNATSTKSKSDDDENETSTRHWSGGDSEKND